MSGVESWNQSIYVSLLHTREVERSEVVAMPKVESIPHLSQPCVLGRWRGIGSIRKKHTCLALACERGEAVTTLKAESYLPPYRSCMLGRWRGVGHIGCWKKICLGLALACEGGGEVLAASNVENNPPQARFRAWEVERWWWHWVSKPIYLWLVFAHKNVAKQRAPSTTVTQPAERQVSRCLK